MSPLQPKPREQVLVTADWVVEHLGDPAVLLVEVDDRPALYGRGHLPGARSLSWPRDLQDPVRRDVPQPSALAGLWQRLGATADTTVVFYGDLNNWLAAYGYWLFTAFGYPNVRLLDGGRQNWVVRGLPLTREVPPPAAVAASAVPPPSLRSQWRADRVQVAAAARAGLLLDVRTRDEYTGAALTEPEFPGEAGHRPGHIPGAVGLPWDTAIDESGCLKPRDDLDQLYAAAGAAAEVPIVTYCRIGERSAHTWIVLHELLGYPDVRNYDGSWAEWGTMTGLPIALGPEPGTMPVDFHA